MNKRTVVLMLANGTPLPAQYKDHALIGDKAGMRDCHIQNDLVLLYTIQEGDSFTEFLDRLRTVSRRFAAEEPKWERERAKSPYTEPIPVRPLP